MLCNPKFVRWCGILYTLSSRNQKPFLSTTGRRRRSGVLYEPTRINEMKNTVLAFTRINPNNDVILLKSENKLRIECREHLVPCETYSFDDENEAQVQFEKLSDIMEGYDLLEKKSV